MRLCQCFAPAKAGSLRCERCEGDNRDATIATLRAELDRARAVVEAARHVPELVALTVRLSMDTAMPTAENDDPAIAERVREIQGAIRDAIAAFDAKGGPDGR